MTDQSQFYVAPSGIKLHFLEYAGAGPKLLLVPGITSPAITWGFVAERLRAVAHVFVLDCRGRGLSDHRAGLGHTTADYAGDALDVIRALDLAPAILLGHSMGARVVARAAASAPDLVSRCVMADPPVSGPGRRPYPSPLNSYLENIDAASRGLPSSTKAVMTDAQVRLRGEWLPTCDPEAIIASHRAFHEDDFFGDLPKIECPSLLIHAGKGDVVRDSDADEIMTGLRDGAKIKIDHVGHMMPFDDLDAFIAAVTPFIRAGA